LPYLVIKFLIPTGKLFVFSKINRIFAFKFQPRISVQIGTVIFLSLFEAKIDNSFLLCK